ncbi:hypothetical protein VPH35_048331 [Triticum aestivum]
MATPTASGPSNLPDLAAGWPREGDGPDAPFIGIPVSHLHMPSSMPQTQSTMNPAPPPLASQLDLHALRARLNKARAAAAFGSSPLHANANQPPRQSSLPIEPAPLIVAPPCLVNDVGHIAFAHLPHAGNPSFSVAGSWRGAGCVTFESAGLRDYLVSLGPLDFHGNQVTLEPVELADRATRVFDQLIELQITEFPHELWHDAGIRWALSRIGDVCSVDHYCLEGRDYTAVRALVMVDRRKRLPDSLGIQLPPSNDIKVVKITKLATILDPMGPTDPSPFSSDSDSDSEDLHLPRGHNPTSSLADELPRGPPPSPVISSPRRPPNHTGDSAALPIQVSSGDDEATGLGRHVHCISSDSDSAPASQQASPPYPFPASTAIDSSTNASITRPTPRLAAPTGGAPPPPSAAGGDNAGPLDGLPPPSTMMLPSAFSHYDSSNSSNLDAAFTFSAGASSSDSPTHECVLRRLRHSAKRSADKTKSLRRSSRLAAKEPTVFTDMTTKAVRAKAAPLTATDVARALKDAIHHAQLDIPDAPPASAKVLEIASLCSADDDAVASVAHANDNSDVDGADHLP